MQFIVTGYDGTDKEAMARRLAAREAHLALGDEMAATGHQRFGVAMLDDQGQMIGSVIIVECDSKDELNAWLEKETFEENCK